MLRCPEMSDGVLVAGRIATAYIAALHAHPELQPRVERQDTVVANRALPAHVTNAIDVRARHWVLRHQHNDAKVRTPRLNVESNDAMQLILQIDSGTATDDRAPSA
jgi:uncharacterized protein (DUF2461 family)